MSDDGHVINGCLMPTSLRDQFNYAPAVRPLFLPPFSASRSSDDVTAHSLSHDLPFWKKVLLGFSESWPVTHGRCLRAAGDGHHALLLVSLDDTLACCRLAALLCPELQTHLHL